MKKRRPWVYVMMIIALAGMNLLLFQGPVQAGPPPITCSSTMTAANNGGDNDSDGFTDYQECLANGDVSPIDPFKKHKIYGQLKCPGKSGNPACAQGYTCHCLDPNKQDLFVIMVKAASGSLLPSGDLLQYVDADPLAGGLPIAVHPMNFTTAMAPVTRIVFPGTGQKQNAVMVTESLDTTSYDVLGVSNTGTPNGPDKTTVYTARINAFIQKACGGTGTYPNITGGTYGTSKCADAIGTYDKLSPTKDLALTNKYILHTIAHEVGHVLGPLAPTYDSNYGGYHYQPGTNVIMDQSIYYTYDSTSQQTTFYIGTGYTDLDRSAAKMAP